MPIQGAWNTVKAFFLTQVHLEEPDLVNTFANESLWYVQYFLGQETKYQNKFYLVHKPEVAGKSSWIPSSLKTAAYFVSALIWIIPGALARFCSLDSKDVTATIFADRVTPKAPATRKIPLPAAPHNPERGSLQPANPTVKPDTSLSAPSAISSKKENKVEVASPSQIPERYAPLLEEIQQATDYFAAFNKEEKKTEELKEWLRLSKPAHFDPFYFSRHLKWVLDKNPKRLEGMIPSGILLKWQEEYKKGLEKVKRLKLAADLSEPNAENQEHRKDPNQTLQSHLDLYLGLIRDKTNPQWNNKDLILKLLAMTLYWQCGHELGMSLSEQKLRLLDNYYGKCKTLLVELKLEAYLQEKPPFISAGLYGLLCYLTDHPIPLPVPPSAESAPAAAKLLPASITPAPATPKEPPKADISDADLKKYLILGIPGLESTIGIKAILENDHLFQSNKAKLIKNLNQTWQQQAWLLKEFLAFPYSTPEEQEELKEWIALMHDSETNGPNIRLFSNDNLKLIESIQSILDRTIYDEWKDRYESCRKRLQELGLETYLQGKIVSPFPASYYRQQYLVLLVIIIPFLQQFLKKDRRSAGAWLDEQAQQPDYCYAFFYSADLSYRRKSLRSDHQMTSLLAQWQDLYNRAKAKLKQIGRTKYYDEMPSTFVDSLVDASDPKFLDWIKTHSGHPQSNTPSTGFLTTTKNLFSTKPLTVEDWQILFSNPEKDPNRARRLVQEATEFFKELSILSKHPEKLRQMLEQHRRLNQSYPCYFTRFVMALPELTLKYKKLCTRDKMQDLRTLHFSACHRLLKLGLIEFLDENPFPGQEREPFTQADIVSLNSILKPINDLFNNFLKQSEAKAWLETEISSHPATFSSFYRCLPGICHMEKFLDQKEIARLKKLFPQYLTKLQELGLKEEHYHTLSCQPTTPAT